MFTCVFNLVFSCYFLICDCNTLGGNLIRYQWLKKNKKLIASTKQKYSIKNNEEMLHTLFYEFTLTYNK